MGKPDIVGDASMILEINAYQETEQCIRVREHAGSVLKPDGSGRKGLSNDNIISLW